jgi:alpha-maltose-1-phosphate synthase
MGMPFRVDHYRQFALALEEAGDLRMTFLWNRRGYPGIPREKTRLLRGLGELVVLAAKFWNTRSAERFRFRLYPFYDKWMAGQLKENDLVYSSYGYANRSFVRAKMLGGMTILDAGNSHPENFWEVLQEENQRWGENEPPIAPFHHERSVAMLPHTDFVLSPSSFVARSFVERGFPKERILKTFYPVNLEFFRCEACSRPIDRPFTIVNTSGLSLRKGTPYLLQAFRKIKKIVPKVRFVVTRSGNLSPAMERILEEYSDLPIEWTGYLAHEKLAEHLKQCDLFILPSLEDGFARLVTEAMACGLPVIVSENTGAADFVEKDVTGSIVPIRDVDSIVESAVGWWEKIRDGYRIPLASITNLLSPEAYRCRVRTISGEVKGLAGAGS